MVPPAYTDLENLIREPEAVLASRRKEDDKVELLVRWKHLLDHDNSWMSLDDFVSHFPEFKLEGKLAFNGGSIDRCKIQYERRKKRLVGGSE